MDRLPVTLPAVLPPLRPWSRNEQNRCGYDTIASYWSTYDVITFLVDPGIYCKTLNEFLTDPEKERENRYQTVISRQRFVVSRSILKHILAEILEERNTEDVLLIRNNDGRILVKDHPHIYISLSYASTGIAITVGKWKIGSDIEDVRPVRDKKITASPLFAGYARTVDTEQTRQAIHLWTLVESYAKLSDKNPYPLLNNTSPFGNTGFVSYFIDSRTIFSLASGREQLSEVLVWLDEQGRSTSHP